MKSKKGQSDEPKKKQRQHNNASYTREDLGLYVRSSWEANLARVMRVCGIEFRYEPKIYKFPQDHGNNRYTPDFKIDHIPGHSYTGYIEVKGYMDEDSKVKLKRMEKYYPFDLVLILGRTAYREIEKEFSWMCPEWEYDTKKAEKHALSMQEKGLVATEAKVFIEIVERHHGEEREKVYAKRARRSKGTEEGRPGEGSSPESEVKRRNPKRNGSHFKHTRST